jgi:hypothetical protein
MLLVGPDAVLVAGSGLIIRLRKDIVGSNPTRPTKSLRGIRVNFLLRKTTFAAQFLSIESVRPYLRLSENGGFASLKPSSDASP